ncbi:ATP-binding protein, partial [Candidatus Bathyarchaeota archaeon]|nr:ATP-binding protein [Candidatus Bathyarchaeota archaeon]
MAISLQFKVSSELKNIIGRELITDDFIAIFELVKNSYDANAKKAEIVFKHIKSRRESKKSKIFVIDDGEGMSYDDLRNKWLLVGYSEKGELEKELQNKDFRDKIGKRRIFAGAKGIGRFSCDKLGSKLDLYTKKGNEKTIHVLHMDWDRFEREPTEEFQKIKVDYEPMSQIDIDIPIGGFMKGTILEISSLRDDWDRPKLLKLKRYLQRLINPAQVGAAQEFEIYLKAEDFVDEDSKHQSRGTHEVINGIVRNVLFESLDIRTTQISCIVDKDKMHTELVDKGEFVYRVEEKNEYPPLHDVSIKLFYLNPSAKSTFTRVMGIEPVRYGSVFFYKNGIKINPYGDEGDDWLGLDRRKTQGTRRFLGNRDVVGRIEVSGYQPYFREVSSRDGGVIRTAELELLKQLFLEKTLRRLEKYVVEGINWDSERKPTDHEETKSQSFEIVSQLIGQMKDEGRKVEFNENLLEIYTKKQIEKTPEIIKNIEAVRNLIESKDQRAYIDLQVKAVRNAFQDLRKTQRELEDELRQREKQALFLKYAAEEDKVEIIALQHQIGLGANIVRNHLLMLKNRVEMGELIPNKSLIDLIDVVMLQIQMMTSITQFVTRAKFDLMSQKIEQNLALYIKQYIENIYIPLNEAQLGKKKVKVTVDCKPGVEFKYTFNPFKFIIVIDNLISNSIKANATNIVIGITVLDQDT